MPSKVDPYLDMMNEVGHCANLQGHSVAQIRLQRTSPRPAVKSMPSRLSDVVALHSALRNSSYSMKLVVLKPRLTFVIVVRCAVAVVRFELIHAIGRAGLARCHCIDEDMLADQMEG